MIVVTVLVDSKYVPDGIERALLARQIMNNIGAYVHPDVRPQICVNFVMAQVFNGPDIQINVEFGTESRTMPWGRRYSICDSLITMAHETIALPDCKVSVQIPHDTEPIGRWIERGEKR